MMLRTPLLTLLSLFLCAQALAHAPGETLRLVVVQSYDSEYVWTQHINQGIHDALRGLKTEVEHLYLDAKRNPDPASIERAAREALARIEQFAPQVVITVDDAAQRHLAAPHLKGRAHPQVVFCGVNAQLKLYGFPAANVSGVRERWHFREGFALLKTISPRLRSVAVLVDGSESAGFVLEDLREDQRKNGRFALRLAGVEQAHTFQEWQRKVLALQKRSDALALGLYHSLLDETTGAVASPETVSAWNARAVRKPTLGFTDFAKDHGHLCGVLESGHEQGLLAGQMARAVFERGVAAGGLPVRINRQGVILVNLKTAARLGLTIPYEIIAAAGMVVQ